MFLELRKNLKVNKNLDIKPFAIQDLVNLSKIVFYTVLKPISLINL